MRGIIFLFFSFNHPTTLALPLQQVDLLHDSRGSIAGSRVRRVPLELEVSAEFLADGRLDGVLHVIEDAEVGRVFDVILAALEDTGSDKASVPTIQVTTDNVGLRVVTDHVDVLGQLLLAVDLLHPGLDDLIGDDVGSTLGLTVDDTIEVTAGQSLVLSLQGNTESTQVQTRGTLVLSRAEQITLGEVDRDVASNGIPGSRVLGAGKEAAVGGKEQIQNDLVFGALVVRFGEAHDGVELEVGEVADLSLLLFLLGELTARGDSRVPGKDILGDNDILESVVLSNATDVVALTTTDQDVVVVLRKSLHGSVGLDELIGRDGEAQNLGQLLAAGLLGLTTTVGEKDVRELDAKLVVSVQDAQNVLGLGDSVVAVCQHTVNVESKAHVLDLGNLVLVRILNLGGNDITGSRARLLSSGQPRPARGTGDGQRDTEGIARAPTIPHGGRQAQALHVNVRDRAASGRDLNGVLVVVRGGDGNWCTGLILWCMSSAIAGSRRRASRAGIAATEVVIGEARHIAGSIEVD